MANVRGPGFNYDLIRRKGQKRINIRISQAGKVTVSAPSEIPDRQISSTVAAKRSWVLKHLENLKANRERNNPLKRLLIEGVPHPVEIIRGKRKRGAVAVAEGRVVIETPDGKAETARKILERWLIKRSREELESRTAEIAAKIGIAYKRIYFRNQRTRWGSSSGRGNISYNWRIIMTPPPVQDYLIIHELCHQRYLNHSPDYWKLVERYFPGYREAERWLKANRGIMGLFRE